MLDKALTILLVNDHDLVRQGLRTLFEKISGMTVVGEAADGRGAVDQVIALNPVWFCSI